MLSGKMTNRAGFSVVELMAATVVSVVVIFGVGAVLVDSQKGWNTTYERTYSGVAIDGDLARRTFDAVMRKASGTNIILDDDTGSAVTVRYYNDSASTILDRYARFYLDGRDLKVEYGNLDPGEVLNTRRLCTNVSSCAFNTAGRAVEMVLRLDDGSRAATIVSSAVTHN